MALSGADGAARYSGDMAGAVLIIVALLLFPVLFLMSGALAAGIFGESLARDGAKRYEGSELLELDD